MLIHFDSQYSHWGCLTPELLAKAKKSYADPSEAEGFSDLKEAEQEKVKRGWEADEIPDEDKGPGEPVDTGKAKAKAPAKRAKKEEGDEPPKKRARKAAKVRFSPAILLHKALTKFEYM